MESEGSGWFVDRIEVINIEISNYEPLAAGSYIKSPKELSHPKKGLINLRNKDINVLCGVILDFYIQEKKMLLE